VVTVDAPAKINLYLHVTGKIPDGPRQDYHLLDSLIVFTGYGDTVSAAAANELSLTIEGPFTNGLSAGDDNLVMQAAIKLAEREGIEPRAALTLTKRLPVASGIGGGSADGAAALKALAQLWKIDGNLDNLAADLGADVPVCLHGKPSFVSGFGEIITPAPPLPDAWLVLVNPLIPLSTPEVFNRRTGPFSAANPCNAVSTAEALAAMLAERSNDLTAAATELAPDISVVLAALEDQPDILLARLSGSGATCFGLFAMEESARAAAQAISGGHPEWWIISAKINA